MADKCDDGTEHLFWDDKFPCFFEEVGSHEIILEKNTLNTAWLLMVFMCVCFIAGVSMVVVVKFWGHKVGLPANGIGEGGVVLSTNNAQQYNANPAGAVNNQYQTNYGYSPNMPT